jgi:hypothetical protein
MIVHTGKCSTFGGPFDTGVGVDEGLALIDPRDRLNPYFDKLFLPSRSGLGLARSLNPQAFYCAMRWDQVFGVPVAEARELARLAMVKLTHQGKSVWLQPVDYGPGDGSVVDGHKTEATGRLIDCSPQALIQIGAPTDAIVQVEVYP